MRLYLPDHQFIIELGKITVQYNSNSPVFFALSGEWSYPFTIKATPENLNFFNNPNLPNTIRNFEITYKAQLFEGSSILAEGVLNLEYSDEHSITVSLTATPGNITQAFWTKKLNQFDLGSDKLPTTPLNYTFYPLAKDENTGIYENNYFQKTTNPTSLKNAINRIFFKTKITIQHNGVNIIEKTIIPTFDQLRANDNESFLNDILEEYSNQLNNQNELLLQINSFLGIFTGIFNSNLTIEFLYYELNSSGETKEKSTFLVKPIFQNTITDSISESLKSTWTKPYFFPQVISPKHYSEKSSFCEIINKTVDGKMLRNSKILSEKTNYSLIPMLNFEWAIRKIFSLENYTIDGNFLENTEVKKMLIFNLFTTDKLLTEINYNINVHSDTIIYANHLPEVSLAEYLQMLVDQFGLIVRFNNINRKITINFFEILNDARNILDLTGRIQRKFRVNHKKSKKTQLLWSITGDALASDKSNPYLPNPSEEIVNQNPDLYDKISLKIAGLTADKEGIIKIESPGISPLFGQQKNTNPLRFVFWENYKGKIEIEKLNFDLNKINSIYQKYLKPKIDFQDTTLNIEAIGIFTFTELINFNFEQKIKVFEVLWLVANIEVDYQASKNNFAVNLKLKRII